MKTLWFDRVDLLCAALRGANITAVEIKPGVTIGRIEGWLANGVHPTQRRVGGGA
jgi:hypothetical protein